MIKVALDRDTSAPVLDVLGTAPAPESLDLPRPAALFSRLSRWGWSLEALACEPAVPAAPDASSAVELGSYN